MVNPLTGLPAIPGGYSFLPGMNPAMLQGYNIQAHHAKLQAVAQQQQVAAQQQVVAQQVAAQQVAAQTLPVASLATGQPPRHKATLPPPHPKGQDQQLGTPQLHQLGTPQLQQVGSPQLQQVGSPQLQQFQLQQLLMSQQIPNPAAQYHQALAVNQLRLQMAAQASTNQLQAQQLFASGAVTSSSSDAQLSSSQIQSQSLPTTVTGQQQFMLQQQKQLSPGHPFMQHYPAVGGIPQLQSGMQGLPPPMQLTRSPDMMNGASPGPTSISPVVLISNLNSKVYK